MLAILKQEELFQQLVYSEQRKVKKPLKTYSKKRGSANKREAILDIYDTRYNYSSLFKYVL